MCHFVQKLETDLRLISLKKCKVREIQIEEFFKKYLAFDIVTTSMQILVTIAIQIATTDSCDYINSVTCHKRYTDSSDQRYTCH